MHHAPIHVIRVPAFNDNYLWLFHHLGEKRAFIVDPGDAAAVEAALAEHQLELGGILITHHHPDHTGGIDALLNGRDIPVYGPAGGSVPKVDHPLKDGDSIILDGGFSFQVLTVPGHTLDHIAYFTTDSADHHSANYDGNSPILFCGDTLFAGGCGRLFEGSPEQMYHSLQRLAALPDDTLIYCAHEYTLANLSFAKAVESQNQELLDRFEMVRKRRELNQATVPSVLSMEKATNPFLRAHTASVRQAVERQTGQSFGSAVEVFGAVRRWKDNF